MKNNPFGSPPIGKPPLQPSAANNHQHDFLATRGVNYSGTQPGRTCEQDDFIAKVMRQNEGDGYPVGTSGEAPASTRAVALLKATPKSFIAKTFEFLKKP